MFQKRHYEASARTLREAKASQLVSVKVDTLYVWEVIVLTFAHMFARDNSQFQHARFLEACGYERVS